MKRSVRGFALAVVLATTGASAQGPQTADSAAEARQQYQDGTKAFSAKKYTEAALHFEAAAGFKANAVALYTAGLAWDLASKPERAADAYARALDVSGLDPKQSNVARDRVAALERSLGTLSISAPEGWRVQLDALTEVAAPARIHGTAGPHIVNVRIPGKGTERRDVVLEAGKTQYLELKDEPKIPPKVESAEKPAPPPPATPEPLPARLREPPFWTTMRVAGVGVAGLGVATIFGGALLGISANDAKDAYETSPSRAGFDHADGLETLTNVAFVAGAVLLAGGIVLIALPVNRDPNARGAAPSSVRVASTGTGLVLGGSF